MSGSGALGRRGRMVRVTLCASRRYCLAFEQRVTRRWSRYVIYLVSGGNTVGLTLQLPIYILCNIFHPKVGTYFLVWLSLQWHQPKGPVWIGMI